MNGFIVITGASEGLGAALAGLYVKEGKRVIGLSRSACEPGIEWIKTDLQDEQSIAAAVQVIMAEGDQLEALVNCAGVLSIEQLGALTVKEIDRVFNTTVRA